MDISPWMRELTAEQLPEPYRSIAYQFSLNTALAFASLYQGTGMYFPKLDSLLQQERNQRIRKEFSGYNQKELAVRYGLTERWIYDILGSEENQDQINLFDLTQSNEVVQ